MTSASTKKQRKIIVTLLSVALLMFVGDLGLKAYAQKKLAEEKKEEQTFTRPAPKRPIKPEIPSANRYRQDKVFLEYADSLYKVRSKDTVERQILKGQVKFRQAGLWMYCDSAYYYPTLNSLDAFSNVRMEQGDTLFVYADKLFYNGDLRMAYLRNGLTRDKVVLINKDVTLTTDSLDYDLSIDLGWYSQWGTVDDKVNTLTSLYGEYSPATKKADFYHDVVLVNNRDGFRMLTDTLHYNTETHIADIESRTVIESENDTIVTTNAVYYTDSGNADLLTRSLIIHKDSTGNIITLEGDSIIYDNTTRISRAYMYRDPEKRSTPMVLTDTAQKTTLIGGFGIYNDSTKEALAAIYPLLMEYSQGDTLFLRADTIKTFIVTEMIPVKVRRKTASGFPEFNGVPIIMKDTLSGKLWIDSIYFTVRVPFDGTPLSKLKSEIPADAPILTVEIPEIVDVSDSLERHERADSIEISEVIDLNENQEGLSFQEDLIQDNDSVPTVLDSLEFISKSDSIDMKLPDDILMPDSMMTMMRDDIILPDSVLTEMTDIGVSSIAEEDTVPKIPKDFHVALAYHRARFFKKDMQGVADSMVFIEKDSILYMFRKPIIWSGERQVTGNRIDVHFNDSTADWAYLPESGLISELVDEDFYNQITGKELTAYFENQTLRTLSVSGSVETIFLPQENDSTFNRLINAESSYLELSVKDNKMEWLKMWPEVSGTVTPIFLVKNAQKFLPRFKWWGFLRPKREWYGDQMKWADDLGEVPDALEKYFMAPSDFGEPKSFTGPRIVIPPSSLTDWDEIQAKEIESETVEEIMQEEELFKEEAAEFIEDASEVIENVEEKLETITEGEFVHE